MNFCTLASGSSGNSSLISFEKTHILIDAGISMRRIVASLRSLDIEPEDLSAILITHEHSDHICGLANIVKHYSVPLYASRKTAASILQTFPHVCTSLNAFDAGSRFGIGDMEIHSFRTPHDTPESVGYRIFCGKRSVALVTDLGTVPVSVFDAVCGADAVILEANHDIEMLKAGSYPPFLKKRILGNFGHLSNRACGEFAVRLLEEGTRQFVLAHLSKDNNLPELAFSEVDSMLRSRGAAPGRDFELSVAPRTETGKRYAI